MLLVDGVPQRRRADLHEDILDPLHATLGYGFCAGTAAVGTVVVGAETAYYWNF